MLPDLSVYLSFVVLPRYDLQKYEKAAHAL